MCVEITYVKSVQKNLLLEGVSNRNETRRFRLRLISQEMSREIWYALRKKTSRYGHSHEKYFFATDANLVRTRINLRFQECPTTR